MKHHRRASSSVVVAAPVAATVPEPVAVPSCVAAFVAAFGPDVRVPAWFVPMVALIMAVYESVADRSAATFDTWLSAIRAVDPSAPDGANRFGLGGPRDIARAQNCIAVAFALSGVPYRSIVHNRAVPFVDAMWEFVIPVHKCDYRAKLYAVRTMADMAAGLHGDTFNVPSDAANRVVRVWRDTKPADVPADVPAAS